MIKIRSASVIMMLLSFLIVFESCNNKPELKKSGIKTTAVVVDGSSTEKTGRNFNKYTTYSITLKYKTQSGKEITVEKSVTREEYNKVYLNCEVPIIYLPDAPAKMDLILTDKDILYYYGIENRALGLKDLYQVYNQDNMDSITQYLNTVSYQWKLNSRETNTYWENQNKNEVLVMNSDILTYVTYNYMGHETLLANLETDGYIKTQQDSTGTVIFENDNYKIASTRKIDDKNKNSIALTMYFVINMVKTRQD